MVTFGVSLADGDVWRFNAFAFDLALFLSLYQCVQFNTYHGRAVGILLICRFVFPFLLYFAVSSFRICFPNVWP